MKITQEYQASFLGLKPPDLSRIYTGKRKVSWNLAERFSKLYPEKSIEWWRNASPLQIKVFFDSNIPAPKTKRNSENEP